MKWHEFVFSEKPPKRLARHALFLLAWWLYFSFCDYLYQISVNTPKLGYVTVGDSILVKTLLLVLVYAIACYVCIYFLLPLFMKRKWWKAGLAIGVLCSFLFGAAWWIYWNVFPFINALLGTDKPNAFYTKFWPAVYIGIINPTKVVAVACIIKYVKYWWLKQREKEQLVREKVQTELQLLKGQVHSGFLFSSLDSIDHYSKTGSSYASELLLKLADLLSYMLYECDEPLVPLDREISMARSYMEMEYKRPRKPVEIGLTLQGDMCNKVIAPFLLLSFIENVLKQCRTLSDDAWMSADISVSGNILLIKLAFGDNSIEQGMTQIPENGFINFQKRLTLLYPGHVLKMYRNQGMFIIHLSIPLNEAVKTTQGMSREGIAIDAYEITND